MSGMVCAIGTCKNSHRKTKTRDPPISYFVFPKDKALREAWICRCKRLDSFNAKTARICSEHFSEDQFEDDVEARIMGYTRPRKLKLGEIPSLKLGPIPTSPKKSELILQREKRVKARNSRKSLSSLLEQHKVERTNDCEQLIPDPIAHELPKRPEPSPICSICLNLGAKTIIEQYKSLVSEMATFKRENESMQTEITKLREELEVTKQSLAKEEECNLKLTSETECLKTENSKYSRILCSMFSTSQLQVLLKGYKKVIWSAEDVKKSFALRYISKRAYLFVKNNLKIPFPNLSTLRRWSSKISVRRGIFSEVLQLVEIASMQMKEVDKLCVLSFDEVKIKEIMEYDPVSDCEVGPYKQMQVAVVRGLISGFQQIIFADFDVQMEKSLLFKMISSVSKAGLNIVACVADNASSNQALWNSLDVTYETPYFTYEKNKIYVFANVPHLLKLIRNCLIDRGFTLEENKIVSKEPLKSLLNMDKDEIKACVEFTEEHINCFGAARQKVRLASELLSHTTATALKRYKPDDKRALDTAEFIELCNLWFDIFNTYAPRRHSISYKWAYGLCLQEQNAILDKFSHTIKNLKCGISAPMNHLHVFQKGILMSTLSLQMLLTDVKKQYDSVKYLLTHRLNQDALENIFTKLRTLGEHNDHPSPVNALGYLRTICFGKNAVNILGSTNIRDESVQDQLIADVLRKI